MKKWLPIQGYEQFYKVSSDGVIVALKREWITGRSVLRHKEEHELRRFLKRSGYEHTQLTKNGVMRQVAIHRIVAETFIPNPENKKCVNHKDGNKLNNNVSNLEWASYRDNNNHALTTGLRTNPSGKENGYSVPVMIHMDRVLLGEFASIKEASIKLGIDRNALYSIASGRIKNSKYSLTRIQKR